MTHHRPKSLADFPQFLVSAVRRGETSADGYTRFELDGRFDRVIHTIDPHWFWLLFDERGYVCATLQSLDHETLAATLSCNEADEPQVTGKTLAYLSPRWQAYQVWMVLDPNWGWERRQFFGSDAVAEDYDAGKIARVGDRDVRVWTKLEIVGGRAGASKHYPSNDQTLPPNSGTRLVPGGWGHEHCDLCTSHIEVGEFGHCDPNGRWICKKCYERYVVPRDLAFVDEL
ncbi:MAG TPA: hypothetical protein VKP61_11220 [Candidatus Acidoferrum sp.]|nr:hypothetical protein [Candidatus Acidoferrum sp.]